jgi:fructokinase
MVLNDLKHWGVRLEFAQLAPRKRTPIVVQRISRSHNGNVRHRFSWDVRPSTPLQKPVAENLAIKLGNPQVLFIDRVFPGAIDLAMAAKKSDALVVFEPSGIRDPKLFRALVGVSDIVKYSRERLGGVSAGQSCLGALEIETCGSRGLRYRSTVASCKTRRWHTVPAIKPHLVRDSAGSGDWCTAGIIHCLGQQGSARFRRLTHDTLLKALLFGQSLAAWNLEFEGARGAMLELSKTSFRRKVQTLERVPTTTASLSGDL